MDWERLGRIALVLVLFAILVLYMNPVVNFVDAWSDSRAESEQLADLKGQNEDLRERAAICRSPTPPSAAPGGSAWSSRASARSSICPPEGCQQDPD